MCLSGGSSPQSWWYIKFPENCFIKYEQSHPTQINQNLRDGVQVVTFNESSPGEPDMHSYLRITTLHKGNPSACPTNPVIRQIWYCSIWERWPPNTEGLVRAQTGRLNGTCDAENVKMVKLLLNNLMLHLSFSRPLSLHCHLPFPLSSSYLFLLIFPFLSPSPPPPSILFLQVLGMAGLLT